MLYKESIAILRAVWIFALVCLADGVLILSVNLSEGKTPPLHGYAFDTTTMTIIAGMAAIFSGIIASGLGAEATWTSHATLMLPAGRWRTALKLFAVDIAAIVVAVPLGIVAYYLPLWLVYRPSGIETGPILVLPVLLVIALCVSLYGMSTLFGVLVPRRPHWSVLLTVALLALFFTFNFRAYGKPSSAAKIIGIINPFAYYDRAFNTVSGQLHSIYGGPGDIGFSALAMLAIAAISLCLATWYWSRYEPS